MQIDNAIVRREYKALDIVDFTVLFEGEENLQVCLDAERFPNTDWPTCKRSDFEGTFTRHSRVLTNVPMLAITAELLK